MKNIIKIIAGLLLLVAIIFIGLILYNSFIYKKIYIYQSINTLNNKPIQYIQELHKGIVIRLNNGDINTIIMNHDCCSGDGFTCVILKNTKNEIYIDTEKNFCGTAELGSRIYSQEINKNNEDIFFKELKKIGLNFKKIQ